MTTFSLLVSYNLYFIATLKNKITVLSREGESAPNLENSKISRHYLGFIIKETETQRCYAELPFSQSKEAEPELNQGLSAPETMYLSTVLFSPAHSKIFFQGLLGTFYMPGTGMLTHLTFKTILRRGFHIIPNI